METHATVKGLVLIPAALRRRLGIKPGTRIHISEENGRLVLQPITRDHIHRVRGMFKGSGALKALMAERKRDRERENGKAAARIR
ncbi:MAG: AbrB/MazE/SpoVT family DNA-binding domain-containing protein [Chloroflexota bacterium]|nr:AbrB/MazE/SpoVT family DNA-binding domain-containing protein [Chloroflexota bacterium]